MFNLNNNFLIIANSIYVINFYVFILYNYKLFTKNKMFFSGFLFNKFKIINLLFVLNFAGLPPFFFFFFKMLILLKTQNTVFVLTMFMLANTTIIYYYINFIYNSYNLKNKINVQYQYKIKSPNVFYLFLINSYFYVILDYINYFLLCLIYPHNTIWIKNVFSKNRIK